MNKRAVVFAMAAPVAVWLGLISIGRKPADAAGVWVWRGPGLLLPIPHGLLVETIAAGALIAYLTR